MPRLPRLPKPASTPTGRAFEGAFEAAISVVIAFIIGHYADQYFGTDPALTFIGFVLGGIAAFRRLLRIGNPPPEGPSSGAGSERGSDGNGSTPGSTNRGEPSTVRRGVNADRGENGSGG